MDVLYDSDNGSLLGYFSDDSEIENGHRSVYTAEYSSEASSISHTMRKHARHISSSDESDIPEDKQNWKVKENIVNIKLFTETTDTNCSVLQRLGTNATPLWVFKQVLCDDFFEMIIREMNRYAAQMEIEQTWKWTRTGIH